LTRRRLTVAVFVLALGIPALAAAGPGGSGNAPGFHTSKPSMLAPAVAGATVKPIITTGDTLPGGYMFEAIPDGISFDRVNGRGTVDILVNHELSLVPFPATRMDFSNALVSKLRLHQQSAGVLKGDYAIPSSAGYQRFCSNFAVGAEHGFERELLFTNEEARDIVLRRERSWEPGLTLASRPDAEQAGVVVAYDLKSGEYRSIYGMGRHNHENSVAVPGYGYPVVLSGDDTFDAPASQLYLYKAASGAAVWNDQGALYAFKSDDATVNDYGDLSLGEQVSGTFIQVPRVIATGKLANGRDITSADFPMPGVWASPVPAPPTGIPDGPQWVLEVWSNANNVFQFIRIEDTAYDRNNPFVQYLADTGEPRAIPSTTTTRLARGPSGTTGPYPNGRIFKLVMNPTDPLKVDSLSILIDGDLLPPGTVGGLHQPDNLETTPRSLLIQEDPGSHNQYALPAGPGKRTAAVWRYDLATGSLQIVALVDQSSDPTGQRLGAWESSGIIDASHVFGPGAFLLDVQAHGWEIAEAPSPFPGIFQRRENGQLQLLRVPGA
jgi:hypothetical protein